LKSSGFLAESFVSVVLLLSMSQPHSRHDWLTKSEQRSLYFSTLLFCSDRPICSIFLKSLDSNGDNMVDFKEFMVLVGSLTCVAHNRFIK
uniref:EF-hand domain-containing protein n=1 Tax=Cyprinodon variegatus TaxID=28743 RepID=A0A3Q2E0V2_CYPVA